MEKQSTVTSWDAGLQQTMRKKMNLINNMVMHYVSNGLSTTTEKKTKQCVELIYSEKVTPDSKKQFTLNEVKEHHDSLSCWLVLSDKVYDVTDFLLSHPGGEEIILENAGTDATEPFDSIGHSGDTYKLMEQYCIGELIESDRRFKKRPK